MPEKIRTESSRHLRRNVGLIYGLAFFHSFMIILPVIVPFFFARGLGLADIFVLQAFFAAVIVCLEAPSGYFADLFGRRFALLIGSVIYGAGLTWLNFAEDFFGLMLFELALGISASLLSGADLALLYDTRKALAADEELDQGEAIANLGFFKSSAEALGALLGGTLALVSFELLVLVQSFSAWICLLLALLLVEPPYQGDAEERGKQLRILNILRHLLAGDPLLRQVVIAIPLYNLATFQLAWLVQPYWQQQGISLALFGGLWFAQSMSVALANRFGFALERRAGATSALALIGLLPVLGYAGMAIWPGWLGIGLGMLVFVGRGLNQVILLNALNRRVPSEFRATANSFASFLFRLAFIVTGPGVGMVAENQGLHAALALLAAAFLLCFFTVMLPLINSVKAMQQKNGPLKPAGRPTGTN